MSQRDLCWIKWVCKGASNKKRSPAQDNPRFKFSQPKFRTLLVSTLHYEIALYYSIIMWTNKF